MCQVEPEAAPQAPLAKLFFCIDVRSERLRRALEQVCPELETGGFAGFFGLPIAYTPLGTTATRPQLPGLLAPQLQVSDSSGDAAQISTWLDCDKTGWHARGAGAFLNVCRPRPSLW